MVLNSHSDQYERSERGGLFLLLFLKGKKATSDGSYPPSFLEDLLSIRLSCSSSEEVLTDGDNLKADVILEDVTGDDRY